MILVAGDFHNSGTATAWRHLREGKSALESLEPGIREVEANEADWSVGLGGYPNALGEVELDGGVMDGRTRASGAVGSLRGFLHPVSVAYAVMRRLPHVLLVGEGAMRFAAEIGAERAELLTDIMRENLAKWQAGHGLENGKGDLIKAVRAGMDPQHSGGTTVYLAQDANGDIAAATSTSGWAWKYPGRLGDTPVAGAGFYADNRFGAAACTGRGELAIRTGLARFTVALMQTGRTVKEAVREGLSDVLRLPDGHNDLHLYAIDNQGNYHVASIKATSMDGKEFEHYYYVAKGDDETPQKHFSERITR